MINKFLIGCGYHERSERDRYFAGLWMENVTRTIKPDKIVIVTTGKWFPNYSPSIQQIRGDNLGHVDGLAAGEPEKHLCGWSASVMALCLIAYNCRRDLVYLEQDALVFGPVIEQAYADMGNAGMVFGRKHESDPWMPCSQSFFVIRWKFLLPFVMRYLALPADSPEMNPEGKFARLEEISPTGFARLSFGVDRERPIPWDAPVWYAQRFSDAELTEARERRLL